MKRRSSRVVTDLSLLCRDLRRPARHLQQVPETTEAEIGHDKSQLSLFRSLPPGWEEESIDNSGLPDVLVASGRELPRVAGKDSRIVREVVVQPEVSALRVDERNTIAGQVV